MHEFMKNTLDWILDKEERLARKRGIPDEEIDKQMEALYAKKERYQQECDDMLHEYNHLLTRLQAIKEKNREHG